MTEIGMAEAAGHGEIIGSTLSPGVESAVLSQRRRVGAVGSDGGDAGDTKALRLVIEAEPTTPSRATRPQHALPRQEQSVVGAAGSHVQPRQQRANATANTVLAAKQSKRPTLLGFGCSQPAILKRCGVLLCLCKNQYTHDADAAGAGDGVWRIFRMAKMKRAFCSC